jgi:hypothetical protein
MDEAPTSTALPLTFASQRTTPFRIAMWVFPMMPQFRMVAWSAEHEIVNSACSLSESIPLLPLNSVPPGQAVEPPAQGRHHFTPFTR